MHMDVFEKLGFEIEPFGGMEYALSAIPDNLFGITERSLFLEILDDLVDQSVRGTPQSVLEKVASMSCKAAVKGNHRMSTKEAHALIDELLTLDNPYNCHMGGRRSFPCRNTSWRRNLNENCIEIGGSYIMTKEPLIILTGPTAVGKTALSLSLAERVNGEIISADSMQVYRGMDIGSAKIMPEEQKGIPHHLIDVLDPDEEFHVVRFVQMAKEAMEDIRSRGKVPILTGGTGFYIQAMLYDIDFTESGEDDSYRRELETYAKEAGGRKAA